MNRQHSYVPLDEVMSTDLNTWQDNTWVKNATPLWLGNGRPWLQNVIGVTAAIYVGPSAGLTINGLLYNGWSGAQTVDKTNLDTGSDFTPSTWHYIYGYISSGSVHREISVTGPDATLTYKNGDTSRYYIGPVPVDQNKTIVPMDFCHGKMTYRWAGYGTAYDKFWTVLNGGTSASLTALPVISLMTSETLALVPAISAYQSSKINLLLTMTNASTVGYATASIYTAGDTGSIAGGVPTKDVELYMYCPPKGTAAAGVSQINASIRFGSGLDYIVVKDASGAATLTVHVAGFEE